MELKQGKRDKCESRLEQLSGLLQPVLKPSSRSKLSKNEVQEPLLLGHPQTCECVNCIDITLDNILIRYSLSVAKYLTYVSRPEQSGEALELVHSVCQCAEKKKWWCVFRDLKWFYVVVHVVLQVKGFWKRQRRKANQSLQKVENRKRTQGYKVVLFHN